VRSFLVMVAVVGVASWAVVRHSGQEAEATERPGRPQEVQSVAIDGLGDLPMANLRAALATHIGEQLDRGKLDQDRATLQSVLVSRGYLEARVDSAEVVFDANQAAFVVFRVELGGQFHVRSVSVTGAGEHDAGVVTLARGEVMRPELIERARASLAERLAMRGKRATVVATIHPDEHTHAVDVELSAH
jgi:outer membrane protein assembly factor BamA